MQSHILQLQTCRLFTAVTYVYVTNIAVINTELMCIFTYVMNTAGKDNCNFTFTCNYTCTCTCSLICPCSCTCTYTLTCSCTSKCRYTNMHIRPSQKNQKLEIKIHQHVFVFYWAIGTQGYQK